MTDEPPARVRVTGPPRRRTGHRPTPAAEIDAGTPIGAVYMASLLREQRRLAVRVLATIALTVGLLPVVFHLAPSLNDTSVLGLPLGWLLLAIAVHPLFWLLGWAYVRRAEANERDFTDLLGEVQREEDA